MKIYISIILTLILLFGALFSTKSPSAQEPTFERVYSDYVFNFDQYRKAWDEYELARSNYLASETLASKSEAEKATLKMLELRDEVVITHLISLRKKISDTAGINSTDRDSYFSQIDLEIDWYRDHKESLSSAGSLENLVDENDEAQSRYVEFTDLLMYKSLGMVQLGKVGSFRSRIENVVSELNTKIGEIRSNGDKNTQKAERGLLDTDARIERSRQKEDEARKILDAMKKDPKVNATEYGKFQTLLIESNQFLKEAVSFLREIIRDIKTAD